MTQTSHSSISRVQEEKTYGDLHQRLNATLELLTSLGLKIPPSSRFGTANRELERLGMIDASEALAPEVRESLHDLLLDCDGFVRSIEAVIRQPEVVGWRDVAQKALEGQASFRFEGNSTPARDSQFELLIAAMLRKAGLSVLFAEPDIQVELSGGRRISVAAKRVKVPSKLPRRVAEGSKQIAKSGLQGIVAVHLPFFTERVSEAPDMSSAMEKLRQETRSFTHRHAEKLCRRVDRRHTFGLLVYTARLADIGPERQQATVLSLYQTNLCSAEDKRCLLLDSLRASLDACLETWLQ